MRIWSIVWSDGDSPECVRRTAKHGERAGRREHGRTGPGLTAMDAKDAVVDDGGHGEVVEEVGKVLPHVAVPVLDEALLVEAVHLTPRSQNMAELRRNAEWLKMPRAGSRGVAHLRHGAGLVVAPEERDAARVAQLQADEERDRLHAVVPSVHVVACVQP